MSTKAIILALTLVIFLSGVSYGQKSDSLNIRKVNPTGALFRSALIPGWGQFYNGKYIKATIFAGGEGYLVYGIAKYWKEANRHRSNFEHSTDFNYQTSEFFLYSDARDMRNLRLWILAASIFYSMFDAYVDAQLSDFNQTDKAYQVYVAPAPNAGLQLVLNIKIK